MQQEKDKKPSGNKYIIMGFIAVLAVLAIAAGMFYAFGRGEKDVLDEAKSNEAKEISLLDESIEAQRIIDNILLKKDNWQLIEKNHGKADVKVPASKTTVKISQRQLAVGIPESTSLEGAEKWLGEKATAAGLMVMAEKKTTYKDWDAYQIDIGIAVKAGNGKKNFLTDKIVFYHNGNLHKEDKDIQEKPPKDTSVKKQYSGKLAIIIDDCGYDMSSVRTLLNTGLPFSYAILPYKTYSSDVLEMVKSSGHVAMLHLPMEPENRSAMSEGAKTICTDMSSDTVRSLVRNAAGSLHGIAGVNNHQGSLATSDAATMDAVLAELKSSGLFFVDSRTSSRSVAKDRALASGVPTARNDIFLDNSSNVADIRAQIYKALEMADKNGTAIAICHARSNTAKAWSLYADEIKSTGIEFVHVTELLY